MIVVWNFLRVYAPYITLPFAAVVGVIGYNVEKKLSRRYTPAEGSILEKRLERKLHELSESPMDEVIPLGEDKTLVRRSVFLTNTSPSLEKPKA
ncbi:unnamed protein product [Notodromas monacha]|uniref:Small integral membrane protein 12 n=1 Tax=Notodromas monacha TaxID=399045 RepID=A0A7R9BQW6_9CRUS|nr:unnamed protein product [Notodromas monacha]CAG0919106.1 unnamed protein product [Notodromas monacha]